MLTKWQGKALKIYKEWQLRMIWTWRLTPASSTTYYTILNSFIMVVCYPVGRSINSDFFVNSFITVLHENIFSVVLWSPNSNWTKKILIDNQYKTFTNQSESDIVPAGCLKRVPGVALDVNLRNETTLHLRSWRVSPVLVDTCRSKCSKVLRFHGDHLETSRCRTKAPPPPREGMTGQLECSVNLITFSHQMYGDDSYLMLTSNVASIK